MYGLTEELKPCPFCGGRVIFGHGIDGGVTGIQCCACKSTTKFYAERFEWKKNEAVGEQMDRWIEAWNRRSE